MNNSNNYSKEGCMYTCFKKLVKSIEAETKQKYKDILNILSYTVELYCLIGAALPAWLSLYALTLF